MVNRMSGTPVLSIFACSILASIRRSHYFRVSFVGVALLWLGASPTATLAQTDDGQRPSQPPRTSLPPGAVHSPFAVGVGAVAAQVVQRTVPPPIQPAGQLADGLTPAPPNLCENALVASGKVPLVTVRRRVVVLGASGSLPPPAAVPTPFDPSGSISASPAADSVGPAANSVGPTAPSSVAPTVMVDPSVVPVASPDTIVTSVASAERRPVVGAPRAVNRPSAPPSAERGLVRLTPETGALVVARLQAVSGGLQRRDTPPTALHRAVRQRSQAGGAQTPPPLFGAAPTSPERRVALDIAHRIFKVLALSPKLGAVVHSFEPRATVGQFISLVVLDVSEPDASGNFAVTGVLPDGVVKTFSSERLASLTPEVAGQFLVGPVRLNLARLEGEALERFQEMARVAKSAAGGWVRFVDALGQVLLGMLPSEPFLLMPPSIVRLSGGGVPPLVEATVAYLIELARGAPAAPPEVLSMPGIIYTKAISPPRLPIPSAPNSGQGPTLIHPPPVRGLLPTDGVWPSPQLQQLVPVDPAVVTPSETSTDHTILPARTYQVGAITGPGSAQALAQLVARTVAESGQELELVVRVARPSVTPSTGGPTARPTYDRAVVRGHLEQVRPGPNGVVDRVVVRDASGRRHEVGAGDLLYAQPFVEGQALPPIPLSTVASVWPNGVRGPTGNQIHPANRDWFNSARAAFAAGAVVLVRITDAAQFPGQILVAGQAAGVTGQYSASANSSGPRRPVLGVGAFEAAYSGEAPRSRPAQNSVRPDAVPSAVEFSAVVVGVFWDATLGKWFVHFRELPPDSGASARTVGVLAAPLDEALALSVARLNPDRLLLAPNASTSGTANGFRPNGLGAREAVAAVRARMSQLVFWGVADGQPGSQPKNPIEGLMTGFVELPSVQGASVLYRVHFRRITGIDPCGEFVFGPVEFRDFQAPQLTQLVPLRVEDGSWRHQRAQRLQELGLGTSRVGGAPAASNVASYGAAVDVKVGLVSRAISQGAPIRLLFRAAQGGQWFQYDGYPSRVTVDRAADGEVYVHVVFEGPTELTRIAANNSVVDSRQLSPDSAEVRIPAARVQTGHVQILPINGRTSAASRP